MKTLFWFATTINDANAAMMLMAIASKKVIFQLTRDLFRSIANYEDTHYNGYNCQNRMISSGVCGINEIKN